MNATGPAAPTADQLERARKYATTAVLLYGEHDDVQRIRSGSNGIWNDHPAVQAALAAIADLEPAQATEAVIETGQQVRDSLTIAIVSVDASWTEDFPGGPDSDAAIRHLHPATLDVWRKIRAALGKNGPQR